MLISSDIDKSQLVEAQQLSLGFSENEVELSEKSQESEKVDTGKKKKRDRKEYADMSIAFLAAKEKRIDTTKLTHPLGERVIYMCDSDINYQDLGNLGAIPSDKFELYETYYICVTEHAYDELLLGIKNKYLLDIENEYNKSKREKFTYKFILESDLKAFIEFRKEEERKVFDD